MQDLQQQQDQKEQRLLKQKIETLERENYALKKSLYELSTRFNALKVQPFQLSSLLDKSSHQQIQEEQPKSKQFNQTKELKGHQGAIYTVKYSPCGKLIATGSFDKTVRIWDYNTSKELNTLQGHQLNISDLDWFDSNILLSGGYDQTCKIWDIEAGKLLENFNTDGFVQCVAFNPIDSNIFFCGTSRNILEMTDRRAEKSQQMIFKNDSMVNTMYNIINSSVYLDGSHVVSGDANGYIKTWDTRTGSCINQFLNDQNQNPISHLSFCESIDEDPRFLAVNSYDNVMRVYDRGIVSPYTNYKLTHALKGFKSKNWPIKHSFYKIGDNLNLKNLLKGSSSPELVENEEKDVYALLATGSADSFVYVYGIGLDASSELIQTLEGHGDRVYAVDFHPVECVIASASADFTVKIWSMSSRKRNK